jgi:hypothetical protein
MEVGMEINESTRNIIVTGFGLAYLFGGIANFLFIYKNGFERFVNDAWLPLSQRLIQSIVIPNTMFFMILLFIFQVLIAIAILSRGPFVIYGLMGGAAFSLWAVFVDKPTMSITYFILGMAQIFLVFRG